MVTPDTAWKAVFFDQIAEKLENSFRTIIGMSSDAQNKSRVAVNKPVDHNFPTD
jgi:hypothetical protein